MSALTPTWTARFISLPGAGKTTQLILTHLRHQPTLARNFVEKDFARPFALEAIEARL